MPLAETLTFAGLILIHGVEDVFYPYKSTAYLVMEIESQREGIPSQFPFLGRPLLERNFLYIYFYLFFWMYDGIFSCVLT